MAQPSSILNRDVYLHYIKIRLRVAHLRSKPLRLLLQLIMYTVGELSHLPNRYILRKELKKEMDCFSEGLSSPHADSP